MATTIRTGAIYGIGVYGVDRYGISNVLHTPDGVDATCSVGSFSVVGAANVSVDGVAASTVVDDVSISGTASIPVTGVDALFFNGSVVVLENEIIVLLGLTLDAYVNTSSVITTTFIFLPEQYDSDRVVYIEAKTSPIQRFIYVEQQSRVVVVEGRSTSYMRTSNIDAQHRQSYINHGTTTEERTILVEE